MDLSTQVLNSENDHTKKFYLRHEGESSSSPVFILQLYINIQWSGINSADNGFRHVM